MNARLIPTIYNFLLICLFIGLLSAPAIKMFGSDKSLFSFSEKRPLASFPPYPQSLFQADLFFSELGIYLDDHFGYRDFFIYRYQRELRKRFGLAGNDSNLYQGLANWFYFGHTEMLLDFAGRQRLSDTEMKRWMNRYNRKKLWLAEQGIQYLLVIPPDKESVYPEFVMESWQELSGKSKLQQLMAAYPELAEKELVDLATPLKKQKNEPVFFKSDTHWTPVGAYTAYLLIADKIEQKFPAVSFKKDFTFSDLSVRRCTPRENRCGDLTRMLLDFEPFEETFRKLSTFQACSSTIPFEHPLTDFPPELYRLSRMKKCDRADLKAVVFRDSFLVELEPFLSENFSR